MTTLVEAINEARYRDTGAAVEENRWIGSLFPFDPIRFPDTLMLRDFVQTEGYSALKMLAPGALDPTDLLKAHLEQSGIHDQKRKDVVQTLVHAFEPVVNDKSLRAILQREITLGDLRSVGAEGLQAFDTLRSGWELEIASALLIASQ